MHIDMFFMQKHLPSCLVI